MKGLSIYNPRFYNAMPSLFFLLNLNSNSHFSTATFHYQESPLSLRQIKQLHGRITTFGLSNKATIIAHLLAAIAISPSTSSSDYPITMFRRIHRPNIFASNNIIRCLGKSESPRDGLKLYASMCRTNMLHPNNYTYPFVLQACSNALGVVEGVQVHAHIVKLGFEGDVFIRNSLIHFYTACCETDMSRRVFDESPQCRDVVTWNVILASYAKDERIDMMEDLFEEMPERDVISWSTMIMGYVQVGELETGLKCFREMRGKGLNFNEAILVTALSACAQLGLLEQGQFVHSSMNSLKFPMSVSIGAGLIDMYAKCGCIEMSKKVFSEMPRRDVWAWNVMINGLAMHGFGKEAVSLFKRFIREGLSPSNVTFVGILNACSRAGLVNDGRHYFKLMREIYGIEPEMEHYGCMVDLLGRAGFVSEGLELIEKMLIKPDPVVWATLLAACKIHGLVELGETIGEKLIQLDPTHDGNYVLLANIYAKSKKWGDVIRVRRLMVDRGATKVAGWSLIEAEGKTHKFIAGDRDHERSSEIYKKLKEIESRLLLAGYAPDISPVLHDISEEEKENVIREHSERLAIAFGFLVMDAGSCIRVVKNLRACGDCHEVCKMISKVFEREIIVRDGSRFHHFMGGMCSCLDYW